ncbi:ribosome biogenesis GTP-binding protein YihA/YsxC [Buchnera aphidicola]|uniref:Probable GTP-binding protein EngB n=1 Tax=Buchnera aphidicola (Macrosiphum gaurae) TaxID=2315801 RepID=A0A4D6Y223_9GAMM|nr:ribosome biogenesis GTP-binding protein YihA/YsxC [Buchnera aphidicola]QCI22869.1 YihA family ribosome biogenesis GTP-binding protein [Buchnera aphidicola (Macrosiphum gaurae)]
MNILDYNKTSFLKSYSKTTDIEIQDGIEIAFVGYSNSGKSSAINTLTNQKKLAHFSKTPGRTQLINFFEVVSGLRIADLPGYGYAKAPFLIRKKWQKMLYDYLEKRNQVKGFVFLMDIRYPLKKLDQKIINIAFDKKVSILILLTKCEKMTISQQNIQFNIVRKKLNFLLDSFEILLFSSHKKIGIKKLRSILSNWYNKYIILNK